MSLNTLLSRFLGFAPTKTTTLAPQGPVARGNHSKGLSHGARQGGALGNAHGLHAGVRCLLLLLPVSWVRAKGGSHCGRVTAGKSGNDGRATKDCKAISTPPPLPTTYARAHTLTHSALNTTEDHLFVGKHAGCGPASFGPEAETESSGHGGAAHDNDRGRDRYPHLLLYRQVRHWRPVNQCQYQQRRRRRVSCYKVSSPT